MEVLNIIGATYVAVLFMGVNNSSSVQPVVSVERTVFYRERAAGMYSAFPYAFAQVNHHAVLLLCHSFQLSNVNPFYLIPKHAAIRKPHLCRRCPHV